MFVSANFRYKDEKDELFCYKILYATQTETLVKKMDLRKSESFHSISFENSRLRLCDGQTKAVHVMAVDFKYLRRQDVPEGFSGNFRICQDDAEGSG